MIQSWSSCDDGIIHVEQSQGYVYGWIKKAAFCQLLQNANEVLQQQRSQHGSLKTCKVKRLKMCSGRRCRSVAAPGLARSDVAVETGEKRKCELSVAFFIFVIFVSYRVINPTYIGREFSYEHRSGRMMCSSKWMILWNTNFTCRFP